MFEGIIQIVNEGKNFLPFPTFPITVIIKVASFIFGIGKEAKEIDLKPILNHIDKRFIESYKVDMQSGIEQLSRYQNLSAGLPSLTRGLIGIS